MNYFNAFTKKMDSLLTRTVDWLGLNLITSIIVSFILEVLLRRSFVDGIVFIKENPLLFLLNVWIVLTTVNLSLFFRNRKPCYLVINGIWLVFGIVNFIMMSFRRTPLSSMDGYEIAATVVHSSLRIVILVVVILLILAIIYLLRKKLGRIFKKEVIRNFFATILWISKLGALVVCLITIGLLSWIHSTAKSTNVLSTDFGNLRNAFMDYGFTYCFSNSVVSHGIKKPDGYSKDKVTALVDTIDDTTEENDTTASIRPNIILVQLESFFDVSRLKDTEFTENPIPNFTRLKEENSTGYLKVPSFGAGTVNTEFEIITSMNLDNFGTGEYPYRTLLQFNTVESAPYQLAKLGYTSYTIHNNAASFYKRNEVLKRLGFDYFMPIETMDHIEYNPIGWAKDKILTEQIHQALDNSEGKDFIHTISVQPHNEYPETKQENLDITIKDSTITDSVLRNQLEYYVNQIHETDAFVGDLITSLESYDEPTVVVFYGDHLPPMDMEEYLDSDKYLSEYAIWSNYDLEKKDRDITTYQLIPYTLDQIGIHEGTVIKYHQAMNYGGIGDFSSTMDILESSTSYEQNLRLLQYDMLYGKQYVYNGTNPYEEKDMKIGITK